ncbi:hypothetical protein ACFYV7_39165 [Nocardia suismassiliense]|uniref:Uncharacterized protein n=1 Tax=Nocardia suismassiliense TaxID=2077092 RepID=A0ABW6R5S1_9NOCA
MWIDELDRKYRVEVALVSKFCVAPARLGSSCGGFFGIGGELPNGLTVWVSNGEMEHLDEHGWVVGLHVDGGYVGHLETGSLAEQLAIAASLTAKQARALAAGSTSEASLPDQIITP